MFLSSSLHYLDKLGVEEIWDLEEDMDTEGDEVKEQDGEEDHLS